MNILLIGGSDNLSNRLIASLNKEGHRVSVLTGSYNSGKKYGKIFERYNFPYSSNVLTEIFDSVSPDLTICMGIHDSNYKWEDIQKDSVNFLSAFMNILNAYSALGRGRLVLLSSDAVYRDSFSYLIPEQTEPDANDLRGLALVQAESMCERYRSGFGSDILTIRLSGNYWQPRTLDDIGDPVSRMCLRVLKDGRVVTVSHRSIMLIHNSDAAFFITKLALSENRQHSVYNLSSGVPISLSDLASIVNTVAAEALEKQKSFLQKDSQGSADEGDAKSSPKNSREGSQESGLMASLKSILKGSPKGDSDIAPDNGSEPDADHDPASLGNPDGRDTEASVNAFYDDPYDRFDDHYDDEYDWDAHERDMEHTGAAIWPGSIEASDETVTIRSMGVDHGQEALGGNLQSLLSTERFSKEFGINHLADLKEKISETITYMLKHKAIFLVDDSKPPGLLEQIIENLKQLAMFSIPYLENIICFVIVFIASSYLKDSKFFSRIDLYLLYVMLFSILYGQTQSTVSAFLSIFSLVIPAFSDKSLSQIIMDYSTYVWIAQLFIVGLAIGYLKDRLQEQRDEAKDDHEYMTAQVDDIRDINSTNSRVKDTLETQLINQENSVTKIYEITSGLNQYNSVDVLFQGTEIICRIMGSRDVSVYVLYEGSPYARLFTATSERARQFGKSFRFKEESGDMYAAFQARKPYVNRTWDQRYPSIANLVYEGDINHFVIMVWNLPLEKLNQGQANLLKVVCMLTKESVFRAQRYFDAVRHEQVVEDTDILLREPFRGMVDIYDSAAAKHLTDFMVLRVMLLPEGLKATAELLRTLIRPNDQLGLGLRKDAVYVLLSNATSDEGEFVIERLAGVGLTAVNANHELI